MLALLSVPSPLLLTQPTLMARNVDKKGHKINNVLQTQLCKESQRH